MADDLLKPIHNGTCTYTMYINIVLCAALEKFLRMDDVVEFY